MNFNSQALVNKKMVCDQTSCGLKALFYEISYENA